ncbi:hypothetical protein [Pandoraea communis]|uniref:hypothetical protein n=1 Tax=Pandoraea communis TaxID=2508297 RepID=UPI0025A67144|nr:hypothetical protein [Pandoraea communis]MDM8355574.1 hypothetical protein [Pandoraea communis]
MSVNVTGSSNVSLTRTLPNTATLSVDTSSTITNAGTVILTGSTATGRSAAMLGTGNGNTLVNTPTGVITTTGGQNDGMAINGNNGSLTNNGTITVSGPSAYGMTAAWRRTVRSPSSCKATTTTLLTAATSRHAA